MSKSPTSTSHKHNNSRFFKELRIRLAPLINRKSESSQGSKNTQATRRKLIIEVFNKYKSALSPRLITFVETIIFPYPEKKDNENWAQYKARRKAKQLELSKYKSTEEYWTSLYRWNELLHGTCHCGLALKPKLTPWNYCTAEFCSPKCKYEKSGERISKAKKALFKDPEYKSAYLETYEASCLAKYGVRNAHQDPEVILKAAETLKANHKDPEWKAAYISGYEATSFANHGTRHPSQSKTVLQRIQRSTYGFKTLKFKGYTFTGLQGFEPQAIKYLISRLGVKPQSILAGTKKGIPTIRYNYKGSRVYHPDMLINGRTVVEVKSTYTLELDKPKLKRKLRACLDAGYRVVLIVLGNGKFKPRVYKYKP